MIAITGNTFAVKEQLKALGGRWDATAKAWNVPDERAEEARALVAGAAPPARGRRARMAEAVTKAAEMPASCRMHTKGDGSWWLKDARGIECARVCSKCEKPRMAGYRPEIFTSASYWHDEPIECD